MANYKKILVAFDGSDSSRNALKQAVMLAQKEKADVEMITVVPCPEVEVELAGSGRIPDVMKGQADRLLEEAVDMAGAEGIPANGRLERGKAYEWIVRHAEEAGCDLIVMGRKGLSRLDRMLMGSETARVIGHSGKDVLVIPEDTALGWENVLLATDNSEFSEPAARRSIDFAKAYGSTWSAVFVVGGNDEFYPLAPEVVERLISKAGERLEETRKRAESVGLKAYSIVKDGVVYRKIVQVADECRADILFMGSHGRTGLKKFIIGSVTEKVIGHATCPVFVVKT